MLLDRSVRPEGKRASVLRQHPSAFMGRLFDAGVFSRQRAAVPLLEISNKCLDARRKPPSRKPPVFSMPYGAAEPPPTAALALSSLEPCRDRTSGPATRSRCLTQSALSKKVCSVQKKRPWHGTLSRLDTIWQVGS